MRGTFSPIPVQTPFKPIPLLLPRAVKDRKLPLYLPMATLWLWLQPRTSLHFQYDAAVLGSRAGMFIAVIKG